MHARGDGHRTGAGHTAGDRPVDGHGHGSGDEPVDGPRLGGKGEKMGLDIGLGLGTWQVFR